MRGGNAVTTDIKDRKPSAFSKLAGNHVIDTGGNYRLATTNQVKERICRHLTIPFFGERVLCLKNLSRQVVDFISSGVDTWRVVFNIEEKPCPVTH